MFGNAHYGNKEAHCKSMVMSYRGKRWQYDFLESKKHDPLLGCDLTMTAAIELRDFLTQAILSEKQNCDYCYGYQSDSRLAITGEIKCKKCGALLQSACI